MLALLGVATVSAVEAGADDAQLTALRTDSLRAFYASESVAEAAAVGGATARVWRGRGLAHEGLERLPEDAFEEAVGGNVVPASDASGWARAIFRARQGPELWWPLLVAAAVLLALESLVAAAGKVDPRGERRPAPAATPASDAA